MALTKAEIAENLFEKVGLNKADAKDLVEAFSGPLDEVDDFKFQTDIDFVFLNGHEFIVAFERFQCHVDQEVNVYNFQSSFLIMGDTEILNFLHQIVHIYFPLHLIGLFTFV